jgi:hypothetical protein
MGLSHSSPHTVPKNNQNQVKISHSTLLQTNPSVFASLNNLGDQEIPSDSESNTSDGGDDDQALLAEGYVDLNDTASSDHRQYPDGMDCFWMRSNINEIGWATVSYSQNENLDSKTLYKECLGCGQCPTAGCKYTHHPKLGKGRRKKTVSP